MSNYIFCYLCSLLYLVNSYSFLTSLDQADSLVHEPFDKHRRNKFPGVIHYVVPFYEVKSLAVVAAENVDVLAVS